MNLHTTGMEFASEMVIHSLKKKLRITEITITYYTRSGESKLSSFRDAWRHIRFMLLYSPRYMFLWPGIILFALSILASVRLLFGPIHMFNRPWDIHVMVFSSMFAMLGWQILNMGLAAKMFARAIDLEESSNTLRFLGTFTLERALFFGLSIFFAGLILAGHIIYIWARNDFGELAQIKTGILSLTLIVIGLQTIFTSFLLSMCR